MNRKIKIAGVSFEDSGEEENYDLIIKVQFQNESNDEEINFTRTIFDGKLIVNIEDTDDNVIEEFSYLIPDGFDLHKETAEFQEHNPLELIITIPSITNSNGE